MYLSIYNVGVQFISKHLHVLQYNLEKFYYILGLVIFYCSHYRVTALKIVHILIQSQSNLIQSPSDPVTI